MSGLVEPPYTESYVRCCERANLFCPTRLSKFKEGSEFIKWTKTSATTEQNFLSEFLPKDKFFYNVL